MLLHLGLVLISVFSSLPTLLSQISKGGLVNKHGGPKHAMPWIASLLQNNTFCKEGLLLSVVFKAGRTWSLITKVQFAGWIFFLVVWIWSRCMDFFQKKDFWLKSKDSASLQMWSGGFNRILITVRFSLFRDPDTDCMFNARCRWGNRLNYISM